MDSRGLRVEPIFLLQGEIFLFIFYTFYFIPLVTIADETRFELLFLQVIEVLIRAEDGLSRDVVKHLNYVSV
jgi:hypothetical protein